MLRQLYVVALIVCVQHTVLSQSISTFMGARANALGYSTACLQDEWSLFNNAAGLAKVESPAAFAAYHRQPTLPVGDRTAAGFCLPSKLGVAGVGLFRFGDQLYNEQILSAAFANQFGLASLGLKVNYIQYNAEGFGRKGVITVSLGGIAELTPLLKVGAHIVNINQPKLSRDEDERIPTILIAGMAFTPTDKVMVVAEVEKDIDYSPTWKTALEYKPIKKAAFRTGFNIAPEAAFFGVGFYPKKLRLDYAIQYSVLIGTGHQASLTYQF